MAGRRPPSPPVLWRAYATDRLKEAAPATVKYELSLLRRAMTLAVKQGRLISRPAFPEIQVHNARVGFFEQAEFEAVVHELPEALKRIALVGYYTGWRKSEILGLKWAQVDFAHGSMRLEPTSTAAGTSTKNNEGRTFPFGEAAALAEALRDAARRTREEVQRRLGAVIPWVWHREDGSRICKIDEAWRSACKRAGYPGPALPRPPAHARPQSPPGRRARALGDAIVRTPDALRSSAATPSQARPTSKQAVGRLAGNAPDEGAVSRSRPHKVELYLSL